MERKKSLESESGKAGQSELPIGGTTSMGEPSAPADGNIIHHSVSSKATTIHSSSSRVRKNVIPLIEEAFEDECLRAHNDYRAQHGVPPLRISKPLCEYAREWATKLAYEDSVLQGRPQTKYGENLYMKFSSDPNYHLPAADVVDSWYSGVSSYIFGQEPSLLQSGEFTQVVWQDTQVMGTAYSTARSGKVYVVAYYDPPGNVIGAFTKNVLPRL